MGAFTYVNKNNQRYFGIEHAGHKSKSGLPVHYFFCFVQQTCQTIARISSIIHLFTECRWAITQDNRMVHQI